MRRRWGGKTPRACVWHGALRAAFSDLVLRDEAFFLIPAVTVGAAGGEGVFPHEIRDFAGFGHVVVQAAQGGG